MNKTVKKTTYLLMALLPALLLSSCGSPAGNSGASSNLSAHNSSVATSPSNSPGTRSNAIQVHVPTASGEATLSNEVCTVDYSNSDDGYIGVQYTGSSPKVKLRITGPDEIVYTYDILSDEYAFFPLTSGNGAYTVGLYENIQGTEYSTAFYDIVEVTLSDELSPYLYPNQYVWFDSNSDCVVKGSELVTSANNDLDAVSLIYNYIISNITYDYTKAESSPTGYISDVDYILSSGTGICLDYAAVMTTMLRSQGIPTRLEVGYAGDAYHAWISVYIKDIGWVNGVVEFTGATWTLMDPTFGANTDESSLKKYIGDGTNYTLQKIY